MTRSFVLALRWGVCVSVLLASSSAFAQKKGRVVTISEVTIVGRVQKPIAAVDVSRIQPKLTLAELKQPFVDRIEKSISHDPFCRARDVEPAALRVFAVSAAGWVSAVLCAAAAAWHVRRLARH